MKDASSQNGFSAVELLISMFIAVAFIASGYQLYSVVIKDGADARYRARASNIAYSTLRLYAAQATNPCTTSTVTVPMPASSGLAANAQQTVATTCPYGTSNAVSLVTVTLTYGTPQQGVVHAIYASN